MSFHKSVFVAAWLTLLALTSPVTAADVALISAGASWRYLDTGTAPSADWVQLPFQDGSWKLGAAELGYGDGGEATVVGYGPDPGAKYITTWFRHTFTVDNPSLFGTLRLQVLRDDGCVVYLNGVEVARYNLPAGIITPSTLASTGAEYDWDPPVSLENSLQPGANVVAVEMHQSAATSSDLSFALRLEGLTPVPTVTLIQPATGSVAHQPEVEMLVEATDPTGLVGARLLVGHPLKTITFTGPGRTVDTYLSADTTSANYGTAPSMVADGKSPHAHALLRFLDLTGGRADQLPPGSVVSSARLRVYCANSSVNPLTLYGLTEDWDATQATWLQRSAGMPWSRPGADGPGSRGTLALTGDCTATGWRTFDVTALVQSWCEGAPNLGFVMVDTGTDGISLATVESATPPELVVEFGATPLTEVAAQTLSGTSATLRFWVTLADLQDYIWNCEVENTSGGLARAPLDARLTVDTHYPGLPEVLLPLAGGTPAAPDVPLVVRVTDPDPGDTLNVTFHGRSLQADGEPFTVVMLPDTQNYVATAAYASIFTAQTDWIVNQRAALNIPFVTHVGDVVNVYSSSSQYDLASASMAVLDAAGIPYGVLPGNHDQPTTLFNQYFGPSRFNAAWYGGGAPAGQNDNSYQLFSAGGMDFLAVHLGFWPDSAAVQWANSVLQAFPSRIALISTHGYLNLDGTRNVHVMGSTEYLWQQLVVPNPNVRFVFCGHVHGEARRSDSVDGRVVHQLLADYQSLPEGGQGWMRLLRFVPGEDRVYVRTWSPHLNQYQTDADSEFSLDFPMSGFAVLGQVTGRVSGQEASFTWRGLTENAVYEWYASVTDASGRTTRGPIHYFTPTVTTDSTPPTILWASVETTDRTSAQIVWETSEASSSTIQYTGDDGSSGSRSDPNPVTHHELQLTGLRPGTRFVATLRSTDAAGNASDPVEVQFTTTPNGLPVAHPVAAHCVEDTPVAVTLEGADPDDAALAYAVVTAPEHGTLSGSLPNLFYIPSSDYYGTDRFAFAVSDGFDTSPVAWVTVTITPVNDPPQAAPLSLATPEDTPVSFLLKASDPDQDPVTFAVVAGPAHGTLSGTAPHLTYIPNANASGVDRIEFQVSDGSLTVATTVTITVNPVNDPPIANAGPDQVVATSDPVTLDATASADCDGPLLAFTWSQLSGPAVALDDIHAATPTFLAPQSPLDTQVEFAVEVTDGSLASTDTVQVLIENRTYDAFAAADSVTGDFSVLQGSATDSRARDGVTYAVSESSGGILEMTWRLAPVQPPGEIQGLTLRIALAYTDQDESVRVLIRRGEALEDVTSELSATGEFSPVSPDEYVDAQGCVTVWVRDDRNTIPDGQLGRLEVDQLYAHIQALPPADTTPPASPTILGATPTGRAVAIRWESNTEPDLAGYRVFRQGPSDVTFTDVSGLVTGTTWADTVSADGRYQYRLVAEDLARNVSPPSEMVSVDVFQPALHVDSIALSVAKVAKKYQANALVKILDQRAVSWSGVAVTGDWLFKGTVIQVGASALTDNGGVARFTSPLVTGRAGNLFTFRVVKVSRPDCVYDPAANHVTQGSIAIP